MSVVAVIIVVSKKGKLMEYGKMVALVQERLVCTQEQAVETLAKLFFTLASDKEIARIEKVLNDTFGK
jgi:hypothetical protein